MNLFEQNDPFNLSFYFNFMRFKVILIILAQNGQLQLFSFVQSQKGQKDLRVKRKCLKLVINDKNNTMGCVNGKSHTNNVLLPRNPNHTTLDLNTTVQFNKNISMIPSQRAFQPDMNYIQTRKKRVAEFAMHFRIESVMNIINQSIPFESVTQLDLKKCGLPEVDYMEVFPNLQNLNLSINCIEIIRNLSLLSNLTTLNLGFNIIKKIENLHRMTQLRHLYLHNNEIQKIEGLQTLINLIQLSLGGNKIKKIKKLDTLTNLQILGLEMNQIQRIENLHRLTSLRLLTLGGNKIRRIQNLQTLDNLEILSIEDNMISRIQNIYSMAKHLKQVKLEHNYINLQEEDFTIRQIALTGTLIYVSPQKQQANSFLAKILPNFFG